MKRHHPRHLLTALASAALLAACGGGGSDTPVAEAAFELSPTFQLAQALPPEPDDTDADGSGASALQAPGQVANASAAALSGSGLGAHILAAGGNGEGQAGILATSTTTYYTPAQIRAAYGLSSLPGSAAYQGAGQTIAIIGAYHNADIARELSTFSQKYGLAACTTVTIAATAALPLAKAGSSCTLSTVYATAAGAMTTKVPGTSASWKTESSLDVEWAHAIAPLARIILVEAASASDSDIQGAIQLAGKLGASVVSMSFGASEFAGQSSRDAKLFQAAGVSYVASTGDKGRGVSWPAVSTQVLGVGGTTLAASGSSRSESGWSGSGGGISAYTAVPAWQAALKVTNTDGSVSAPRMRTLPDVAFNADPNSGQMLFVVNLNGSSGWVIAGGTSVAAPQWAGLLAVANAVRASAGKAPVGKLSAGFYGAITGNANTYNQNLYDVLTGKNGACKGCTAGNGYDLVTGLGSPKAPAVINQLVGL